MATQGIVKLAGAKDLVKKLESLGVKAGKDKKQVILKAAEVVRAAAENNAPVDTGNLKENIVTEILAETKNAIDVAVGPAGQGIAFYGLFIEFGADPHWIPREKGNVVLRIGNRLVRTTVKHPGLQSQPFLRPAFDENIEQAVNEGAAEVKKSLGL